MSQSTMQARVVTTQTELLPGQGVVDLVLFKPDGTPWTGAAVAAATASVNGTVKKGVAVTDVAAVNASDLATAQALANETKAKLNALLASLRTAGVIS